VGLFDKASAWNYTATTTSFTSPTATPTWMNELAVACWNSNSSGPGTFTWGGGFGAENNVQVSTQVAGQWGDQILGAPVAVTATGTTTNTINGMMIVAFFSPPVFNLGRPFRLYPPPA